MSCPRVSIVIPAHQRAHYLSEALDSVLEQDYEPLDVIALDDGSTDETPEMLAAYAEREDPDRFRWSRHANIGQAATVNRGFEMARGDVMGTLSDDDRLYPGALRRLVEGLQEEPEAVAVHARLDVIGVDGERLYGFTPYHHSLAEAVRRQDQAPSVGTLFHRRVYDAIGGWNIDLRYCPDYEYWIRVAGLGPFAFLREVVGAYRVHPGSITFGEGGLEMARERIDMLDSIFADPSLAARLEDVRDEAYRNVYFVAATVAGGDSINARGERFFVHDSRAPELFDRARDDLESESIRYRIALESAQRQLDAQGRVVDELSRALRVYRDGRGQLEAAVAERDERIRRLQSEGEPRAQVEHRPWWWRAGRWLVPVRLRPLIGALAHRMLGGGGGPA